MKVKNIVNFLIIFSLLPAITLAFQGHSIDSHTLQGKLASFWKEDLLPFSQKLAKEILIWWKENIWPKIENWLKKKKPALKEELEKEKEEMKEGMPRVTKSPWEKFKELIK